MFVGNSRKTFVSWYSFIFETHVTKGHGPFDFLDTTTKLKRKKSITLKDKFCQKLVLLKKKKNVFNTKKKKNQIKIVNHRVSHKLPLDRLLPSTYHSLSGKFTAFPFKPASINHGKQEKYDKLNHFPQII